MDKSPIPVVPSDDDTFDKTEAADFLKCSERYLYELTRGNKIGFSKVAGRPVYLRRDLVAFLEQTHVKSGEEIEQRIAELKNQKLKFYGILGKKRGRTK